MKEKLHAFWDKHPTAQVAFAYPFLIIVYVVFGTLEAFWSAIKTFFGTFVECYGEFNHHIATIKKNADKNRKSLKEKLQSRVQKV